MLKSLDFRYMMNGLRILGNFLAINEKVCTEMIKELGLLDSIKSILTIGSRTHKKEALWVLSNVAANSEDDAKAIIKKGLMTNLICCANDKNVDLRKEAIWVLSNICYIILDSDTLKELISCDIVTLIYEIIINHNE